MAQGEAIVFVSYTGADETWAAWVAAELVGSGLAARVQMRDTPPEQDPDEWTNTQLAGVHWTVALYSQSYFASDWCTGEWAAALARTALLPVRLEPVTPPVALRTPTWVDLFDLDEGSARRRLLYAAGARLLPRLATFPSRPPAPAPAARPAFPAVPAGVHAPSTGHARPAEAATAAVAAALDQLGSPEPAVRLAGIRALAHAAASVSVDADPALAGDVAAALAAFLRDSIPREVFQARASFAPGVGVGAHTGVVGTGAAPEDLRAAAHVLGWVPGEHGLDLTRAWLPGADMPGANLRGANLTDAELAGANLAGADLSGANLTGVGLSGANLSGARLKKSIFVGAGLAGADFSGADLAGADLTGAWVVEVNLSGVAGLTPGQVGAARGDASTVLPAGLARPPWPDKADDWHPAGPVRPGAW